MIVIGTRGSKLALIQAHHVSRMLARQGFPNEIKILKTKGDVVQDRFDKIEGKGFFTREIEDALLAGTIDLAVHCLKDLPTQETPGLSVRAIPPREDPYDLLISKKPFVLTDRGLPDLAGLIVGTSSNRRVSCLARNQDGIRFVPIRGNVPTRISKMERGDSDVLVLARAGLNRLGLDLSRLHCFPGKPPLLVPAPGQGALALQTRSGFQEDISFMHHELTARCVHGERRILNALEGGCQLPLGVLISGDDDHHFRLELFLDPGAHRSPVRFTLTDDAPESLAEQALTRIHSEIS